MNDEVPSSTRLVKVFAWVLAILIGGIGWLAVAFGAEMWHLAIGIPLVLLAAWLVRAAQ
jgi:hypothetical protein